MLGGGVGVAVQRKMVGGRALFWKIGFGEMAVLSGNGGNFELG